MVATPTSPVRNDSTSIEGLISQAIEKNLPVETMERLFALWEKVKAEKAKEAYTVAMSDFQAECPIIEKKKPVFEKDKKTVRFFYATLDSIVGQVKGILGKNGISYSTDVIQEAGFLTAVCKITHILGHSETSSFKIPIDSTAFMSEPQKYASACTFAKRHAFTNGLGILTGDEDKEMIEVKAETKSVPTENYESKLRSATTYDELSKVWLSIPVAKQIELTKLKNELKEKFPKPVQEVLPKEEAQKIADVFEGELVDPPQSNAKLLMQKGMKQTV